MSNMVSTISPTENMLLEISFDGSCFHGWQKQPDKPTVQEFIENTLHKIYGIEINLKGSGRTDAGVSALGFMANFLIPKFPIIPPTNLKKALNSLLPESIRIKAINYVDVTFNARNNAYGKAYTYIISNSEIVNPTASRWVWKVRNSFNIDKAKKASECFLGEHDFTAFACDVVKNKKNPLRTIYRINFDQFGEYTCITFIGNSFLYKMVRILTGALVQAGEGKTSIGELTQILELKDRKLAFKTAPSKGLFLVKVFYNSDEMLEFRLENVPFAY